MTRVKIISGATAFLNFLRGMETVHADVPLRRALLAS